MESSWLSSTIGQSAISFATKFADPLEANSKLRKEFAQISPEQAAQAITQSVLRTKLTRRWNTDTSKFLLTEDGMNQATRPSVAKWRAAWIMEKFGQSVRVLDLTCGLGFDALAMAEAGLRVHTVERDPLIADFARHNLRATNATVETGDSTAVSIDEYDLIFVDPMRRDPQAARKIDGSTQRIFNPENWSPSWEFITSIAQQKQVICKVAPGIDDKYISNWNTIWISDQGDLVEAMTASNGSGLRSAVLLQDGAMATFDEAANAEIKADGQFLVVPNSAITRAGAVGAISTALNGGLVNQHIGWITSDDSSLVDLICQNRPAIADVYQILDTTKAEPKAIAQAIREIPASAITITTRGMQIDVERMRKQISPNLQRSAPELVVALYRDDTGNKALICRRITNNY